MKVFICRDPLNIIFLGYPKLKVIYEALKRRVNFSTATLINDVDEMRREAERERESALWIGRVIQVEKEVTENQVEIFKIA